MRATGGLLALIGVIACGAEQRAENVAQVALGLGAQSETWQWVETPVLAEQKRPALAYDTDRHEVVLLSPIDSSTWLWNGMSWRNVRATGERPGSPINGGMTYDAARKNVVVYVDGNTLLWNGTEWTSAKPAARPRALNASCMAYDEARSEVIAWGGLVGSAYTSDTWAWNGTTWTQRNPAAAPAARFGCAMAYDRARGALVLFGGYSQSGLLYQNDAWTWNGTNWTQIFPGTRPPARAYGQLAYDATTSRLVLHGGHAILGATIVYYPETWALSGSTWAQLSPATAPPATDQHTMAEAPGSTIVSFGGMPSGSASYGMWSWNGATWASKPLAVVPNPQNSIIAFDATRGRIVLVRSPTAGSLAETWLWDGASWERRSPAQSPPATSVTQGAMAFDAKRGLSVLLGGSLSDTWTWDGITWTARSPAQRPPTFTVNAAYDAKNEVIVALGSSPGETWTWNDTTWTRAATGGPVGLRLAYDAVNRRVLGIDNVSTWAWDGATWVRLTTTAPGAGTFSFDASTGRGIFFGGPTGRETWIWDHTKWAATPVDVAPRTLAPSTYDATRRSVAVLGTTSVWTLVQLGGACATNADCSVGLCTDGVCCRSASCAGCESCANPLSPGRCTPVQNAEDADTCSRASGHMCDDAATCKLAPGAPATQASDCATGFLVDGVCCNSACTGLCQACSAAAKESGTLDGVCDAAKSGTDLRNECHAEAVETCGRDGMCDGRGRCQKRAPGVACGDSACVDDRATGRLCDGVGACRDTAEGVVCGAYACVSGSGCRADCSSDEDCTNAYTCVGGRCEPKHGDVCRDDITLRREDGTLKDCGRYKCVGSACRESCANIADCVFPNECDQEGHCIEPGAFASQESGCSTNGRDPSELGGALVGVGFACATRRRRRRAS